MPEDHTEAQAAAADLKNWSAMGAEVVPLLREAPRASEPVVREASPANHSYSTIHLVAALPALRKLLRTE